MEEKFNSEMEAMKTKIADLELKHKNEVEKYKKEIADSKKVATPQKKREELLKKTKKRDPKRWLQDQEQCW